jgi:GTPase SAR1 family protein/DNA-binding Xre family transcriptional regulator
MATSRSLKLSSDGKRQVDRVLTDKAWGNDELMEAGGVQEATVKKFRARKPVDRKNFVKFCQALGLDWATLAEPESPPANNSGGAEPVEKARSTTAENLQQIENEAQGVQVQGSETTLVGQTINVYHGSEAQNSGKAEDTDAGEIDEEKIRQHCREKILHNYSKIRLLSGQEIGVDQLYVDVWLLNGQPRKLPISRTKMLETFDFRKDRLGMGDQIQRIHGFNVAHEKAKLVILGKPGCGKTTFLKHLVIDWCNGNFYPDLIAVFIEFRQIRSEKWNILDAIGEELGICRQDHIKYLLSMNKFLILMDGFDEVPTGKLRRNVQDQIAKISKNYSGNRFIMTCRTQILTKIPDGFNPVEIAEFDDIQVKIFVQNWFRANGKDVSDIESAWGNFETSIIQNPALKELTVTPVLLGLICLVLNCNREIPTQRNSLYAQGIELLLRDWNEEKDIPEWELGVAVYRELNVNQKESLLVEIAAKRFEDPENFVLFYEDDLTDQISKELNLKDTEDARHVLKAIEAQHGLLVERADGLWSFSHLTFQEYFTTTWLLNLSSEELSLKIADEHWQQVMFQLAKFQGLSDRLIGLIKQAVDCSISNNSKTQEFLNFIHKKSQADEGENKIRGVRERDFIRAFAPAWAVDELMRSAIDVAFNLARGIMFDMILAPDSSGELFWDLHSSTGIGVDFNLWYGELGVADTTLKSYFESDPESDLFLALKKIENCDPSILQQLEPLRNQLPLIGWDNGWEFELWWDDYGQIWSMKFCKVIFEYINVAPSFQFDSQHVCTIRSYYYANVFLAELLEIENAVSPEARQEIEDNLLLPIAELKRRLPDQYGGIEES